MQNLYALPLFLLVSLTTAKPSDYVKHVVVINLDNWSFDGLFGHFTGAQNLDTTKSSLSQTDPVSGKSYAFLPQDSTEILPVSQPNAPFDLSSYVPFNNTRAINFNQKFYTEQNQINNGSMNLFAAYSSAKGLAMSNYDITNRYLGQLAKQGTLFDHFFHSAFGGSCINHHWLIAGKTPYWSSPPDEMLVSVSDSFPYTETGSVTQDGFAVNTVYSENRPRNPSEKPQNLLPSQSAQTIGDLLTHSGITWRWYSTGFQMAIQGYEWGNASEPWFAYEKQPFLYYDRFEDPYSADFQEHLQDEYQLYFDLANNQLPQVSFVQPLSGYDFNPGSASSSANLDSETWLKNVVNSIMQSSYWSSTAIVIAFGNNGGRWDHMSPPAKQDRWGPGTRVPCIVLSPYAKKGLVEKREFQTLSITRFIELHFEVKGSVVSRSVNHLGLVFQYPDHSVETDNTTTIATISHNDWVAGQALAITFGIILIVMFFLIMIRACENDTKRQAEEIEQLRQYEAGSDQRI